MNFDEAARTFQMTPPPNGPNFMTASFDLHYNMKLAPKQSLHSRSNTISDEDFGIRLEAQGMKKHDAHDVQTPASNVSNSDTYDDDMDTDIETEDDYLSDRDEEDMLMHGDGDHKEEKKPKAKPRAVKSRLRSRTLSRPNSKSTNIHLLRIPNESDDNFDDDDDDGVSNIHLPPIMSNKLHIRSYSESNIQKSIQNNQWHPVHRVRTRSILMRKVTRIPLCIVDEEEIQEAGTHLKAIPRSNHCDSR
eukprot:1093710_1